MHDRNGTPLNVGDEVLIPAVITELQPGEEFCNVTLKTVSGRRPDKQKETISAINTGVLVKFAQAALALLVVLFTFAAADASDKRYRRYQRNSCYMNSCQVESGTVIAAKPLVVQETQKPSEEKPSQQWTGNSDSLDEVNAERAKRGLKPFIRDALLTQAAHTCAQLRAKRFIHGHLSSDFDYLPAGAHAIAAGCGALEPSWGWGSCCTYDNYTYAGAAWVMGSDGRRYMHLFVR